MADSNLDLLRDTTRNQASATAMRSILYFLFPILIIVGALIAYKSSSALAAEFR